MFSIQMEEAEEVTYQKWQSMSTSCLSQILLEFL